MRVPRRARFVNIVFAKLSNPIDLHPIQVSTNIRLDGFFTLTNDTRSRAGLSIVLTVPVGVAIPLTPQLTTGANAVSRDGGAVAASSTFFDTLFLAARGVVFNLPAGYTANSLSAHVVNNHLQPVPAPLALLMLGSALVVMLRRTRRSRPRRIG